MATVEEKRRLREQGMTYQQIADTFGISRQAVGMALRQYNPSCFQVIKPSGCVYSGIRAWMNVNKVSRAEFVRRMGLLSYPPTLNKFSDCLRGKSEFKKNWIDKILSVTGLTYEQAFREE